MPTPVLLGLFLNRAQPDEKRLAACIALGSKPDDAAFEALLAGMGQADWRIRMFSLEAVKRHPRAQEAGDAVIRLLFDVDDQVRQTACKIAGEMRLWRAHEGVVQLLETDNPDVRDAAIGALTRIWCEDDFERVFRIFQTDERRGVRIAAAKTLRAQAGPRTWRRLFQAWRQDREARHRLWCCELAARFGSRAERPAVRELLEDRNRNVRLAAERALGRLSPA